MTVPKNEVKKKTTLLNNYEKSFQTLKDINNECLEEERAYKHSLHDKEMRMSNLQKTKRQERNTYSNALQEKTSKIRL